MFVGRESELDRLAGFLADARQGRGRVVFIAGEAGSGKSALAGEFVRRAEAADEDVVAATGECNAQTGAGDPYLPFRQVLAELIGGDDGRQAARTSSETNAARLREFVRVASATLLDVGPDLIGLFIPGGTLFAKIAAAAARQGKLADKLAANLKGGSSNGTPADQERIFEQYSQVLMTLSRERTLILVLDDLHWADGASLNLLFHLARQITESRVLIVGTYRPDEVALGRGDGRAERHPLEPVLNEIKRYEGDVVIDLGELQPSQGRHFVDALIDSETNCLDEAFRAELYARTEGHALFTTELLRNLEERGDLVRDASGCWVQAPSLNWQELPARVEGVIAERLARLPEDLRDALTTGSIMGKDFVAQVIAELKGTPERGLIQQLSRDLDKRHHLVHEVGEKRIGRRFLSWYSFVHVLFQQFLYDEMGAAERRMLHGEVAEVLEKLYAGHTDEIAADLARHFEQAGEDEKAIAYLICAGDLAFRVYAHNEAIDYFSRALELGGDEVASHDQLVDLYSRRGRSLELLDRYDAAISNYESMQAAAQAREDRGFQLEALLALALAYSVRDGVFPDPRAKGLALEALKLAEELGNRVAEAKAYWILMLTTRLGDGGLAKAVEYGERSLAVARELGLTEQAAYTLNDLGFSYVLAGQFWKAPPIIEETVGLWRQVNNKPMLADGLVGACMVRGISGRLVEACEAGDEAYALNASIHNRLGFSIAATFVGWAHKQLGHLDMAIRRWQEGLAMGDELGHAGRPWVWALIDLASVYDFLGDSEEAARCAMRAIGKVDPRFPGEREYGEAAMALVEIHRGNIPAAQALLAAFQPAGLESYARSTGGPWWLTVVEAQVELALVEGDFPGALAVAEDGVGVASRGGMTLIELPALYLQARALRGLGRINEARNILLEASARASAMHARFFLLPMLVILYDLETRAGRTAEARAAAAQGAEVAGYIADHAPAELRSSFLALPHIAALKAAA